MYRVRYLDMFTEKLFLFFNFSSTVTRFIMPVGYKQKAMAGRAKSNRLLGVGICLGDSGLN